MYTIFINDAVIYLTDDTAYKDEKYFVYYEDMLLSEMLKGTEDGTLFEVYMFHPNIDFLWNDFKQQFKLIEAAGGVVFNESQELLWIYRNGRWDLPKGKIEKNEDNEKAAVREVEEECGLTNVIIKEFIMSTYHIYRFKGVQVLKISHWYKMFADSHQDLKPQLEEGITKASWLDNVGINEALNDTYDNIKLLFENLEK